jgi:hypothetical protein
MAAALAGTAASIGFAGLAAATYTGSSSGTPTTTNVSHTQVYRGESGERSNGNNVQTVPQTVTSPYQVQIAQPPTRSSGRARVTAGGSG